MKDYVIEYYDCTNPYSIYIWETQATTEIGASKNFLQHPISRNCGIEKIVEGTWDRKTFRLISPEKQK